MEATEATDSEARRARELLAHLWAAKSTREAVWRELSRWICPWRGIFTGHAPDEYGEPEHLFTQAASHAVLAAASGMTSGMTPRNIPWFRPAFSEPEMAELSGARQWLDALDLLMQDALAQGGFYQAVQNFNLDLIWSGCALLYAEKAQPIRFECVQVGTFSYALGADGSLDAVCREITMTASGAAAEFGAEKLKPETARLARVNPWQPVRIQQLCRRVQRDFQPFDSFWMEPGATTLLRKSSYHEMPFFHAVWNQGGSPFGTGPGDICLADARQMDLLERHKLAGLGKLSDPPVLCPPEYKDILDLEAGGINYSDNPQAIIRPVLDLSPYAQALSGLQAEIATVRQRIEDGLMASIFRSMPLDQRPAGMSATEFLERKRENLQQLGPVISAYEPTVLTPLLFRVANTLDRAGLTPAIPQSLQGYPLFMKMEFISPMANALRQTGAETSRALFQDIAAMFQATQNQQLFDKLDLDQMIDELATGLGVPGAIVRSDEDVATIRQAREQQQMQQQMLLAQAQAQQ